MVLIEFLSANSFKLGSAFTRKFSIASARERSALLDFIGGNFSPIFRRLVKGGFIMTMRAFLTAETAPSNSVSSDGAPGKLRRYFVVGKAKFATFSV